MPTLHVEVSEHDRALIAQLLKHCQHNNNTHGPLTLETLAAMLLEDVALAVSRPGSWEGSNMWHVLSSHGYGL